MSAINSVEDLNLLKELGEIRRELDHAFEKLDRFLFIAQEKEHGFDFPVAFVTQILYVCEKNGLSSLLHDAKKSLDEKPSDRSRRLQSFYDIIKKKKDYIHLEGLSQTAFVLQRIGDNGDSEMLPLLE